VERNALRLLLAVSGLTRASLVAPADANGTFRTIGIGKVDSRPTGDVDSDVELGETVG